MWDPKKILSLENFVDQQRCVWRLAWDFSMRMAMAKIGPNGFERRESFEDIWKDIYRIDGCLEGCVCGYWMLEADRKLIDTSAWLKLRFSTSWGVHFKMASRICPYPRHPTVDRVDWFNRWPLVYLPLITDLVKATIFSFFSFISTQIYSE